MIAEESEVELVTLFDAWVEPNGKIHEVPMWGHAIYARDILGTTYEVLRSRGWIRLSNNYWQANKVTQRQLEVIEEWHKAKSRDFIPDSYDVI